MFPLDTVHPLEVVLIYKLGDLRSIFCCSRRVRSNSLRYIVFKLAIIFRILTRISLTSPSQSLNSPPLSASALAATSVSILAYFSASNLADSSSSIIAIFSASALAASSASAPFSWSAILSSITEKVKRRRTTYSICVPLKKHSFLGTILTLPLCNYFCTGTGKEV